MKRHVATAALLAVSTVLVAAPTSAQSGGLDRLDQPSAQRLTNLDHLDFLGDTVTPPAQTSSTRCPPGPTSSTSTASGPPPGRPPRSTYGATPAPTTPAAAAAP